MQELAQATQEKDQLYAESTELRENLRKEQLARTSASKEKQAQLRIVAIEVGQCKLNMSLSRKQRWSYWEVSTNFWFLTYFKASLSCRGALLHGALQC